MEPEVSFNEPEPELEEGETNIGVSYGTEGWVIIEIVTRQDGEISSMEAAVPPENIDLLIKSLQKAKQLAKVFDVGMSTSMN